MARALQGKIAIVTGASHGIGRSIAEMFAAEGARTVLVARRAALLEEVAAGIKTKGGEALAVPADLTREDKIVELFATVQKTFGRLDVLVNNAGIATHRETEDISLDYWRAALNIGSVSAKTPRPDSLPYTVTKFGLQGMTHQLTMDGRKHNIVASIIRRYAVLVHGPPRPHHGGPGRAAGRLRHGRRGGGEGRAADGNAAGRSESLRGDDPAQSHALVHRPRVGGGPAATCLAATPHRTAPGHEAQNSM